MNADDVKSLMERSLTEGGIDATAAPDVDAIAGRVRAVRRRRSIGAVAGAAAAAALVGIIVWQASGLDLEPVPPATPTTTQGPTDEPTEPSTDPSGTPSTDPDETPSGTTTPPEATGAVFPQCGEGFELPEPSSQLVVEGSPPAQVPPGSPWRVDVTNTGSTAVSGSVGAFQVVALDAEGVVVATADVADDAFWAAASELSIGAGESIPFAVDAAWGCDGELLGAGDYTGYVLLTVGASGETDPDALEQARSGPFPLVIADAAPVPDLQLTAPQGAAPWATVCGDPWVAPQVTTGFELELIDPIRNTPRAADDDIDGRAQLRTTATIAGTLHNEVLVISDGQVVSETLGSDALNSVYLSGGVEHPIGFASELLGCDQQLLASGSYQVVVVTVLTVPVPGAAETYAIAITAPSDLTIQ